MDLNRRVSLAGMLALAASPALGKPPKAADLLRANGGKDTGSAPPAASK